MNDVTQINRYIIEQLQNGTMDKNIAAKIIKSISTNNKKKYKDIAIIGTAGKFPGANNLDEYWNNISEGICTVSTIPSERKEDLRDVFKDKENFTKSGYLAEIDKFDYEFFNIPPNEAKSIEPAHRIFLETAFETIEDSGLGIDNIYGTKTGVFVGRDHTIGHEFRTMNGNNDILTRVGTYTGILASRVSYVFNLKGPCMVVDTACSSGAVAVHNACLSIINGECDMAIAGGVHIFPLGIIDDVSMQEVTSSKSQICTFDNDAKGSVWGEGVGAVLLKPLDKALADGDNIQAVIKGSAINCDGASNGITAPNAQAQTDLLVSAWASANISPDTISYIEAHGTGTVLGDPIEVKALTNAFNMFTKKKQFCGIGSVKTNIGHTISASGIAGLLKMVMALRNKKLPATLNFNTPNKHIRFHKSPFFVNDTVIDWETDITLRRCGVNSFGFSGTNCHIVLEQAPNFEKEKYNGKPLIFTLSAKNKESLIELILKYKENKEIHKLSVSDVCYTSNTGRGHYQFRVAMVVETIEDLIEKIKYMDLSDLDLLNRSQIFYGDNLIANRKTEINIGKISLDNVRKMSSEINRKLEELKNINNIEEARKLLIQICDLYVKGGEINWKSYYNDTRYRRVSLPVYPLKRLKCPMDIKPIYIQNDILPNSKADAFYKIGWKKHKIKEQMQTTGNILIFLNENILGRQIALKLKEKRINTVIVYYGDAFSRLDYNTFVIGKNIEDHNRLFDEIDHLGISKIIHASTLTDENKPISGDEIQKCLSTGFYSLLYIIKSLNQKGINNSIDILLLSNNVNKISGNEDIIYPQNATLFGIGKVISAEHSNLYCRSVDIDDKTDVDEIINEIWNRDDNNKFYQVAYRNNIRYVEELQLVDIETLDRKEIHIKQDGVYLITGGTGGLGLEVSKYLARKANVNLIFINRTELPLRNDWDAIIKEGTDIDIINKLTTIKELEEKGSRVICYSCDVSSYDNMNSIINEIRLKFGKINGVLHCAGVFDEGYLIFKDESKLNEVIKPKVFGTYILDMLTREDNLDFFILYSSIVTLAGIEGQGGYTAANAFLDSYQAYRNRLGMRTLTINWGVWRDIGGAIKFGANKNGIFKTLSSSEGIKAFDMISNRDINRVLVAEIDFSHKGIKEYSNFPFEVHNTIAKIIECSKNDVEDKNSESALMSNTKFELIGRKDEKYTDIEVKVAHVWSNVLGFKTLDIHDNFYELGGDSRLAIKIANSINQTIQNGITLTDILKYPTIEELGRRIEEFTIDEFNLTKLIHVSNQEYYPVSSAQKRLFIISSVTNIDISYNIPMVLKVAGNFDLEKLEKAFNKIIERHETLRTSFDIVNGEIIQKVKENVNFAIELIDKGDNEIPKLIEDFIRPFDLSKAPLLRIGLINISHNNNMLLFDMHHIISDEASIDLLIKEFIYLYKEEELPELSLQYKDFAVWQNNYLNSKIVKKQEEYWLDLFKNDIPSLNLPLDYNRPNIQSHKGDVYSVSIGEKQIELLNKLCLESGTTLFMTLLATYNILLMKYTQQYDIVVGTPVLGRMDSKLDDLIGMFANTLALRNFPDKGKTFNEFLYEVKKNAINAYENQDYQFEELIQKINIERDLSRNPLFDTAFILRNANSLAIEINDLKFEPYKFENKISKFDLTLDAIKLDNTIQFNFEYCTELFKEETIRRMAGHFINILEDILNNPNISLTDIEIISEEERKRILVDYNNTSIKYPKNATLNSIFDNQVKKSPDSICAVIGGKSLTYIELDKHSNKIAGVLKRKGIGRDKIVGIMAERSFEMLIGMIAILKAGGAYLPINPEYPDERIRYMLNDSESRVLLTQSKFAGKSEFGVDTIEIERILEDPTEHVWVEELRDSLPTTCETDLAYVIYTSGSTGEPKGAMIEHRSIVNRINWGQRRYQLDKNDVILQKTPITFDVSVWELFWYTFCGAKVCLLEPGTENNPEEIVRTIKESGVTVMHFVPSMLGAFLEYVDRQGIIESLVSLKFVFSSGEALKPQHVKKFKSLFGKTVMLVNLYGPTEAAIEVSCYECNDENLDIVPIGKPIDNIKLYITDNNGKLQPEGIPGELWISGEGVGRGYINRRELTEEKFILDPFNPGQRVYRTGDLARWISDGNIEFLGRADGQVKIRGFRIEMGEIEAQLLKYDGISEAVVVAMEDDNGGKNLYAYIVCEYELQTNHIKDFLSQKLPIYMIPYFIIRIPQIPITSNGKLNKNALPKPQNAACESIDYVAPCNDIENKLLDVWTSILHLGKISVKDNFFSIGGNSILLVELFNKIDIEYPGALKITDIFSYPSISKLSEFIAQNVYGKNMFNSLTEFPEEYFVKYGSLKNEKKYWFEFNIEGLFLEKIREAALQQNVNVEEFLLSVYVYIISKLTNNSDFSIYTALDKYDEINLLKVDLNQLKNTSDLFTRVHKCYKSTNSTEKYSSKVISNMKLSKGSNQIALLFYKKNMLEAFEVMKIYDLAIQIDIINSNICIKCDYNYLKLDAQKIEELIAGYFELLKLLIEE